MVNISGKHVLEYIIEQLRAAGVVDIVLVVGYQRDKIIDYFKGGAELGVNITYAIQDQPTGIGDAVLRAMDKILVGEYFMLVYGDTLTCSNIYNSAINSFNSFRAPIASVCLTSATQQYGNIFMDQEMNILKIVEKPKEEGLGNYVLAGAFILPSDFFTHLEKCDGVMERALEALIGDQGLKASIWEEEWVDIGYPWDILRANKMIMDSWERASISKTARLTGDVAIQGPVNIADDVTVEKGTLIKGPCYIGPGSFVGHNALIREYTCIGANSVVGFGVELKNCVLFGGSKVGRLSFVGDSVIGERVYIGSGTMTINGRLDGGTIRVKSNGMDVDTGLTKIGSFIGDGAVVGSSNTLAAGCIIGAEDAIPHHFTFPREGDS
jgi:bifunctional UDP-N-acetylglucosamine pyrophosphorylase/glucosamine-1-phosphate N-acetyltransferase